MSRCKFVAEVSSNHNSDIDRAFSFIDTSAESGCDAVKFQLFKIDQLFAPEILARSETHRNRKDWELPVSFLPRLKQRCDEQGIAFSCTPFYLRAVEELFPYIDFYKIASYELIWDNLIKECAQTKKPLVISSGMATLEEIIHAVHVAEESGCEDLTILHCVSNYPAKTKEANLAFLETLRQETGVKTGWSDHTVSPAVLFRAVHRWDASMVEFHMDLDKKGFEYSGGHCWLPEDITRVITDIRTGEDADGKQQKTLCTVEEKERNWRADPVDGLRPLRHIRS